MQLFRKALDPGRSIYLAAPLLALITFFPSLAIAGIALKLAEFSGLNPAEHLPNFTLDGWVILGAVILGPFAETVLLACGIWLIARFVRSPNRVSAVSAALWGVLHSLRAPLWFVGVVWPFFVFSRAYIAWRPTGRSNAFGVAWLTHSLHNAMAVSFALLLS